METLDIRTVGQEISYIYVIPGDPIPLKRARHGNGKVYDAQKHEKLVWGLALANQHNDRPLFEGPLHIEIMFFINPPKMSERKKIELYSTPHPYKPDLDNLVKFILDVGTRVLYHDDAAIYSIISTKLYADEKGARTELSITELK